MTNGEKVVKKATSYIGVKEVPDGSNRSPQIDKWEARWGLKGEPWCGMYADAMFAEAGVSDSGICHPATKQICVKGKNYKWDGVSEIPPGSLWVNCGIHVAIVVMDNKDGTVSTIEGNKNNRVETGRRAVKGYTIIIPPAIAEDFVPSTARRKYYLEDLGAVQKLLTVNGKIARWKKKESRDKTLNKIKNGPRFGGSNPAPVSRGEGRNKRYFIRIGDLRYYGPWSRIEERNKAQRILERRIGRRLRRFSKIVN
jgi:hypothetical protein